MPMLARRLLRAFRYAMFFDGVDDYVVIPLTVYGWSGITIQEWIYPFYPKANEEWTKFSMIGDYWVDRPSTFFATQGRSDYTWAHIRFVTRRPDGTAGEYVYSFYAYRNTWVNFVRRFSLSDRVLIYYINSNNVYSENIPLSERTILEWDPATATYPQRYRQFVLGANVYGGEQMRLMQADILIYSRALSDSEIKHNYNYPDNPVEDGLVLWLKADPAYVRDIDGDGINEWVDLSGYGNHGKIYGATLDQPIKRSARTLSPVWFSAPAR